MVVLDASVGAGIAREDPVALGFKTLILKEERVIAPSLYQAEVSHVFSEYCRGGYMDADLAKGYAAKALELIDEFVDMRDMVAEATREACRLKHSAYDMFYLVLARRRGAALLTLDKRLAKLADELGVETVIDIDAGKYGVWKTRVSVDDLREEKQGLKLI